MFWEVAGTSFTAKAATTDLGPGGLIDRLFELPKSRTPTLTWRVARRTRVSVPDAAGGSLPYGAEGMALATLEAG